MTTLAASNGSQYLVASSRRTALRSPTLGSLARWVFDGVRWALFGLAVGLVLSFSVPNFFGMHSFVVMSGSMTPVLRVGDVVVDRSVSPRELRVGDIITFHDPGSGGRLVTHRVRRIRIAQGRADIETKGDNNNSVQRWSTAADGRVGLVLYHVPEIGYLLAWTRTVEGRLLILVLVLLTASYQIVEIWRPAKPAGARPVKAKRVRKARHARFGGWAQEDLMGQWAQQAPSGQGAQEDPLGQWTPLAVTEARLGELNVAVTDAAAEQRRLEDDVDLLEREIEQFLKRNRVGVANGDGV